ncbi:MAG: zinc-dependent alcohol dehydrogenase family protein [Anaerolineae bacterium]|nr:zinc-dependent alcohol dehydrogenase family protein [Anaerolineae bacterium]
MKAQVLHHTQSIENHKPLALEDVPRPQPQSGELLVKVRACGICHTDLHVVEGELPNPKLPLIPGHEVVGVVESLGEGADRFELGARVGIPWLHKTDQTCHFCQIGSENLCVNPLFTGYTVDGGYAEYITVPQDYAVPIPDRFSDVEAAPLLCAGIVGFRSIRLSELQPGERLGLYGFGASAHIAIQVARHWGCEVYVFTRSEEHQRHASELGATWVGEADYTPPKKLDRAITFAPVGWIIPTALGHLRKGGTLAINAIHMSDIPQFPYQLLWSERTVRSVANATRKDGEDFMQLAAEIPVHTETTTYPLDDANHALQLLKRSEINGAAVLEI